jgi:NAD(P)-dependent dehydrogenase (short-subunit alcohol dehydrogenase family)
MVGTAVITGAASGIGLNTARELLNDGWTVIGLDSAGAALTELAAGQGDRFIPMPCDVRDADQVKRVFSEAGARLEGLNALICCAGVLRTGPLAEMSVDAFDLIFDVNVKGSWLCAKEALPLLKKAAARREPARIVFLSSVAALRPKVSGGAYAASKAAVSQMTRVLAVECASDGVLVNALAPATVDTPMVRAAADPAAAGKYRPSGRSPLGRIAEPQDVTRVIRFLLGEGASYVTGATIPVDGGTAAAFVPPGVD